MNDRLIPMNSEMKQAAEMIVQSNHFVLLTGAGMSVDSGVNDFRSQAGWWRKIDPRTVATVEALHNNYDLFHAFYSARMQQLEHVQPHRGHEVLSKWERLGLMHQIATQNVDGLHQQAGSEKVEELHGTITSCRCQQCGRKATNEEFINKQTCLCGGAFRPNVVLFGESLPEKAWGSALEAMRAADLIIVIGTSLEVYPVNQLPLLTKGKTMFINKEPIQTQHSFDLAIIGRAKDTLVAIDQWVDHLL